MALPVPTKVADQMTLISYLDTVIDFDHPDIDKTIREYISSTVPDPSILPRRDNGERPTEFTVRPLSEREFGIVEDISRDIVRHESGEMDVSINTGELNYQILRFALVDVANLEGWEGKRHRFYSHMVLDINELERLIDRHTAEFLAMTVRRWSVLEKKTSSPYGSSPDPASGTQKTNAGHGRSTAKSAKSTKGTGTSTAAKSRGKRQGRSDR
tara:strand:- start:5227 stop:5865 length:639 start_codon:yes stop_codon:yes gene_type:complete